MFDLNEALQWLDELSSEELGDILVKTLIESGLPIPEEEGPNIWAPFSSEPEEKNIYQQINAKTRWNSPANTEGEMTMYWNSVPFKAV